ncbi:acyclic terpene utilization AtuA family protein [Microbacterium sp. BR1]|uniref:acyclic terpene utilization AtuA family protein n=1 Tax=Microbacterium sp. BR1 TaxID=1070896 RepID=UPI000C2C1EB2|nr:acyclic terpene utilization AtuA family protein [Microbacterium sp. BR1]
MTVAPLTLGSGAGFAGDRYEPAVELAMDPRIDVLVFECLAERTIALAQQSRDREAGSGFDSRILRRFRDTLSPLIDRGGRVITNAGAANPRAAGVATLDLLRQLDRSAAVAVVTGDDVRDVLDPCTVTIETGETVAELGDRVISANAYIGAEGIITALDRGADVVITGRVGDAALFSAPILHHFAQDLTPSEFLAESILVGHMLECAGQLTGGYFADGASKIVPGLAHLGFPFATVQASGAAQYGKIDGTGGLLNRQTALEQLYYEIADPRRYITPDLIVDFSAVTVDEPGPETVRLSGARANGIPDQLKVSIGVRDGHMAVAEISYSGYGCVARAELAGKIIAERWVDIHHQPIARLRIDRVGLNSTRPWHPAGHAEEVRVRFSYIGFDRSVAVALCEDVEALYTNGPAGGGGATSAIRETVGIVSALIPRDTVSIDVELLS